MRSTRRLSDQEREKRRERDRQRLKQAAEQLLSSDGWQRWVRVRSRNGLARYSAIISGIGRHRPYLAGSELSMTCRWRRLQAAIAS